MNKSKHICGGITAPQGFIASGVYCGLKKKPDSKDLAIIYSEVPAVAAGTFTTNLVKAAPVLVDIQQIKSGTAQAIIVNSGNANACTGKQGLADAWQMVKLTAKELGIPASSVLVASTGVIGQPLKMDKIKSGIKLAAKSLSVSGASDAMSAIMTTDTFPKEIAIEFMIDNKSVRFAGIAKGAGMIAPNMNSSGKPDYAKASSGRHATMLCFITTDAAITKEALSAALQETVAPSFNRITVDGDMSTNDTSLILANGLAGNKTITKTSAGFKIFKEALLMVNIWLSSLIVKDGEGATKVVDILVLNARTESEAKQIGFTIANSSLVKTAIFGNDANWGRIMAAIGRSGVAVKPEKIDIYLQAKTERRRKREEGRKISSLILASGTSGHPSSLMLVQNGQGTGFSEPLAKEILQSPEIRLIIDLHQGKARASVLTCDLSFDYIKINASYRS
ncbi:MAG: bifunctional glutamate N-acetyltransferase/amino-acid acetyltransferase ArgJ [bacterium]|nr:bifunctional glutamate N-acetyltransferase/amino-acid acetyltransferase ArgJ [bacterium]